MGGGGGVECMLYKNKSNGWVNQIPIQCMRYAAASELIINLSGQHIEAKAKCPPFGRRPFQTHFIKENVWISITISLKFVSKDQTNNILALVQIIVRHRPSDKRLSEHITASLLMLICIIEGDLPFCRHFQMYFLSRMSLYFWVKSHSRLFLDNKLALVQVMAWC